MRRPAPHGDDGPVTSERNPSRADVVAGTAALAGALVLRAVTRVERAARPMVRLALRPAGAPETVQPGRALEAVARLGAEHRAAARVEVGRQLDAAVPRVLTALLGRAALTDLVLRYVDLDEVVAAVDLDRAAGRLDVDAVAARLDLARVLERVDVDAVVARADLDAVLDRLDLTEVVLKRVDLDALLQEILARLDLIGLAEDVIDGVDLPEIIRESTGSMASDTVRGARMQGIAADEAVGRAMDRLLLRRGRGDRVPSQRDGG
jgi:hypothetical protein